MNLITNLCNILKAVYGTFLDILFPKRCVVCNCFVNYGTQISMCRNCRAKLSGICNVTIDDNFYFEEAISALKYENYTREAMSSFKFHNLAYLSKTFAYALYVNIKNRRFLKEASFICPVPLHPSRRRDYNQSALIAKDLSGYASLPAITDVLIKTKNIPPLSKMNYTKRGYMVRSAFALNPMYDVSGKVICLVDDIFTTSATVNECSRILKMHGAKKVYVLCPCYTPKKKKGENKNANSDFTNQ